MRVCEVIGVVSRELCSAGVVGYEEVEKDRGDARALRYPRPCLSVRGGGVVVSAAGHPPLEIGG